MGREGSLALVQVLAVVGVGHALPRAERFEQLIDGTHRGQDRASERRDVVEARNVEQRLLVPRRDREPPLSTVLFGREQVACRLMLEPLARVPLVHPRRLRELGGRQRSFVRERPVETEPRAQVDREEIERPDGVHEETPDQGVAPFGGFSHACHAAPPVEPT